MSTVDPHAIMAQLVDTAARSGSPIQSGSLVSAHQYLRLYHLIQDVVAPGSVVLDWGAGNGHFSYFLVHAGYVVSAFAFSAAPELCDDLSTDVYTHTQGDSNDPKTLPYPDGSFDAVVSVGVLEHVRETKGDEIASLREICRVLKPGGLFLCYHLPNRYSWIEAGLRLVGRWSHQYRYTAADIRRMTLAAGLTVVEIQRYAILPRNIWWWSFPRNVGTTTWLAGFYDRVDNLLAGLLSPLCQNYLFVAKKQA